MRSQIHIAVHGLMPKGTMALWRNGDVIWTGPVGSPIEDVECDKITFNQADYDQLLSDVDKHNAHPVNKLISAALRAARGL